MGHLRAAQNIVLLRRMMSKLIPAIKIPRQYLHLQHNEDKSAFKVLLPGWSIEDVNIIPKDLMQPNYLRTFKVLSKWEMLREIGKSHGFLDICEFEKTLGTYMKCVDVQKIIKNDDLTAIGRTPYAYDICLESKIGRIGKSSFQIDNHVYHAEKGTELFRGSLVYVTVDYKTLRPTQTPSSWIEKYAQAAGNTNFPALRVNIRQPRGEETVLHRSFFEVRPSEVDRFGHTNNQRLYDMCSDALLDAYLRGRVPVPTVEYLESCMTRIEVDFVGSSAAGDRITAAVSLDSAEPDKILCKLYKSAELIYVACQHYEMDLVLNKGKL